MFLLKTFALEPLDRLGISYEKMSSLSPKLIYLSISRFGRTGPEKDRPGYDLMMQAFTGLMSITGMEENEREESELVKVGTSVVDLTAGLTGAMDVLAALLTRHRTGE